jgi:hypothetical protein
MRKWLYRDLGSGCLTNLDVWKAIRSHPSIPRKLPLPNTNSPAAKDMRVAAGLVVLARAVAGRIMRPTYLVQDNGIDSVLAELAKHNANQEVYVRASLLKVLPDRQGRGREDGIRAAVQEVEDTMNGWIPEADLEEFRSDLEGVARKIADSWSRVQLLEENIRPSFKAEYEQDWKPLPMQPTTKPVDPTAAPTPQKNAKPRAKQEPAGQPQQADEAVDVPIWPAFLHMGADQVGEALVFHGFGLTLSQMAGAEEEASSRGARKLVREDQATQSSGKRRDSGVFLFTKPPNGSNAG